MSAERRRTGEIHSAEEVEQAILALGPRDLKRLEAIAWTFFRRLGLKGAGRDHEDLVSEALARTLSGERAWRRGVDFTRHLTGTLRSISWTWRERQDSEESAGRLERWEALLALEPDEDGARDVSAELYHRGIDPESSVMVAEEVRAFERHFAGDPDASEVIACWKLGMKGPEIRERNGMEERAYRAAVRRIRRRAQQPAPWHGGLDNAY